MAAINNAIDKIGAMEYPFVNNRTSATAGEAMDACAAIDDILSEVYTLLSKL